MLVVFIEGGGDRIALFGSVEGIAGHVAETDFLVVQFAGHEVAIADSIEPGTFPSHEAFGVEFAGKRGVLGSERLKFVEGSGIADGPGNKGQRGSKTQESMHNHQPLEFSETKPTARHICDST